MQVAGITSASKSKRFFHILGLSSCWLEKQLRHCDITDEIVAVFNTLNTEQKLMQCSLLTNPRIHCYSDTQTVLQSKFYKEYQDPNNVMS